MCRGVLPGSVLLLLALALSGCGSGKPAPIYDGYAPAPPGYYRIRDGDTLHKIAGRHKVGYKTLARWNKLAPPYQIYAGSLLRVAAPAAKGGAGKRPKAPTAIAARQTRKSSGTESKAGLKTSSRASSGAPSSSAKVASGLRWRWPLHGEVAQRFRGGDRTCQGIRIAGRPGQKVLAAESGTVVYSGSGLKAYGNLIIIKHNNGYLSAYGFNRRLLVSEGARVERGQRLAEVGQASGGEYRLHFEIRRNGVAVDPLKYLP